ncbi:MAG: hypothetical protein AAB515_00165 [Patescibacteria group bacterium]
MNKHLNGKEVFWAIALTWVIAILIATQWAIPSWCEYIPGVITALLLAAWFRYWATIVVGALVTLLLMYSLFSKAASAYESVRDPLTVTLEKTDRTLKNNVSREVGRITSNLDSGSIQLSQAKKDSILAAAKVYRKNQEFLQQVAETAQLKQASSPQHPQLKDSVTSDSLNIDTLLNLQSNEPLTFVVKQGWRATVCVDSAWYCPDQVYDKKIAGIQDWWCDEKGYNRNASGFPDAEECRASDVNRYAVIYSQNSSPWLPLHNAQSKTIVLAEEGDATLEFSINDPLDGFESNKGAVRISIRLEPL